jgi:cytoskeletal protein RodZ
MSIDTDLTGEVTPVLDPIGTSAGAPDRFVEVRRRPGVAATLGVGASLVAVAYLARAADGGAAADWVLAVVLAVIGVTNLLALVDARTPLLVADDLGVRLRLGRAWVGLPWGGLHEVEHRGRAGWWRDGMLTVHTHYVQRVLEDLDPRTRRLARINHRLHGSALAVPLGLGTRVVGADPDLTTALTELADGRAVVRDVGPETAATRRLPDPRPAVARLIGVVAARFERAERDAVDETDETEATPETPYHDTPLVASKTPEPVRAPVAAARAEVRRESRESLEDVLEEDTQIWEGFRATPEIEHAVLIDPVIGPQFGSARTRLGLTIDELAERTRIRPHVIEAIEVDDFSACGGDFYARGHLRTLARILGVDVAPILETYDERYADAPIDPRRVFEAELAGAGSIRATRGGPNWSVLVAAVMALVLCWSVARLVTGGPAEAPDQAALTGSGGPNHSRQVAAKPVSVRLTAAGGGARVVVRDGVGKLVFSGNLSYGEQHTVQASPPVRIQSTDGAVKVSVAGQDRGRMGPAGRPATQSYVGRR